MSKLLTTPPLHGSLHGQPTTQLSLHPPVFNIQQPPSPRRSLPSSRGQIHLFLIQARGLHVLSPHPCPYVVVQFEHNEFVSRGPSHDSDLPSSPFWKHHVSLSVHPFLFFFLFLTFFLKRCHLPRFSHHLHGLRPRRHPPRFSRFLQDKAPLRPRPHPRPLVQVRFSLLFLQASAHFFQASSHWKRTRLWRGSHPSLFRAVQGLVSFLLPCLSHLPPCRPVDLSPHEISNFSSSLASAPLAKFSRSAKSTQGVYTP